MEISNALLVAIMFVMILSIGIANLLMAMATIIDNCGRLKQNRVYISWLILLLLSHFNMFWHTIAIVSIEKWLFAGFLYIVTGPILIFLGTNVLIPEVTRTDFNNLNQFYFGVCRRFFFIFALLQLWIVGADFLLDRGFTFAGAVNIVTLILSLILASSQQPKLHYLGTSLAWVLFVGSLTLRGLGIIT